MSSRLAFQTQLASIMEVLANAAVAEICKLVDDDYAVVSLQMSQCQRENKALKRKLHLLELKMARGTAERRLRESAINSSRLRVQICGSDRLREPCPSADGAFDQQTVSLWPDRALTASVPGQSECPQSKSPDVQLVEPEPVIVKEETKPDTKEEVHVIEDNGIMECLPHVPERQQLSLEISPSASGQVQTCTKTRTRTPPGPQRRTSAANRGVEEVEEPDVVLVKVEESEEVKLRPNQTSLIIQEDSCQHRPSLEEQTGAMTQRLQPRCLVESSTDDFRAELPFADAPQTSSNQLQESGQGLSESESSVVLLKMPVSTSTQAPAGSEFSLFELEPFFTRWAPEGDSTEAPSGSFSAANASEVREDAVIILDNEPETEQELREERFTTTAYSRAQASVSQALPSRSSPSPSIRIQSVHSQWTGTPAMLPQPNRTAQQAHTNLPLTPLSALLLSAVKSSTAPPNHKQQDTDVFQKYKKAKRYACKICGKAFPGLSNLQAHQRVHTGERPFRCDTCGRNFSEAGNLKKHQRVHTGEKPFSCEKCGKRFAWICNLKSHQQSASCCGPPGRGGAGNE